MKKLILLLLFIPLVSFGQIENLFALEYDKEFALYYGKHFLMTEVLGEPNSDYSKFELDPLTASNSREITTIYYKSGEKNLEGLVFGFFDEYWNRQGIGFKGYAFKALNKDEATQLIDKIENIIDSERKFLNADDNVNNIYFSFKDMTVLVYRAGPLAGRIRIFWNGFDAEWENSKFNKTKRRFIKATKK